MKNLNLISIICLFLISCTQNKESETNVQDFFKSGTVTITGQVNNLKTDDSRYIFLNQFNVLSCKYEVTTIKIDSAGKFEKIIPVFNPQEIFLKYQEDIEISLLVKQSDNLNLVIDAKNKNQEVIISGLVGVERNKLIKEYRDLSYNLVTNYARSVSGEKWDFILNELKKTEERLDSITNKLYANNKPDALLTNWIEADKKSLGNLDLINYASYNETLPATFLSRKNLIAEKDLNNYDFYCNSAYFSDIFNRYKVGCLQWENRELYGDIVTKIKNDNYTDAINILADSIYKEFRHIGRDIAMYQSFRSMLEHDFIERLGKEPNIDLLKKCYLQNLVNEYIKTLVLNTTYEYRSEIVNLSSNNSEDILGSLLQMHKGKVLYIDISATWCGPCIQEFPYSTTLHENLAKKEIVFVYLFAKSNLSDWKKLSAKYNLQGENILLSDEQYNFLLSKYTINSGFPQYLLIDKNGGIIKGAQRPSMKGTKEEILKLLN